MRLTPSLSEKAHSKQCNLIKTVFNAPQYNSSSYSGTARRCGALITDHHRISSRQSKEGPYHVKARSSFTATYSSPTPSLLAPTGALVLMMVYYISAAQLFQIFTQSLDAIDVTSVTLSCLNSINAIDVTRYLGDILGIF